MRRYPLRNYKWPPGRARGVSSKDEGWRYAPGIEASLLDSLNSGCECLRQHGAVYLAAGPSCLFPPGACLVLSPRLETRWAYLVQRDSRPCCREGMYFILQQVNLRQFPQFTEFPLKRSGLSVQLISFSPRMVHWTVCSTTYTTAVGFLLTSAKTSSVNFFPVFLSASCDE